MLQLQQPDAQQRGELELTGLQRPREQTRTLLFEAVMPAQRSEHERGEQRCVALRDVRPRRGERVIRVDAFAQHARN